MCAGSHRTYRPIGTIVDLVPLEIHGPNGVMNTPMPSPKHTLPTMQQKHMIFALLPILNTLIQSAKV
jgi:hypothetical protein